MNVWKTVLFIFCVLCGFALICVGLPKDGVKIGNVTLEWPTLKEALTPAAVESTTDVDEALQARINALRDAKQKEFDEFCSKNPARIYLPNNDTTYLDAFFEALDNAGKKPVRILHYGDSQLECDRMTADLREHFQSKFGGGGVGMVPAVQPIATYTLGQSVSPALRHYCAYGSPEFRAGHWRYGPMASMSRVDGSASFSFTAHGGDKFPHCQEFQKVSVAIKGSGSLRIRTTDSTYQLTSKIEADSTLRIFTATLARKTNRATLNVSGNMDIYGIMLDGKSGVAMDNIPMRGCSGTMFTSIDRKSFAPFFKQQNVGLIILQYGGNSVPYLKGPKSISTYADQVRKQIALFRRVAPKARILFIGPSDMATSIGGRMQTYPHLAEVIDSLRTAVNGEGAAYWDMQGAMGGNGSMVQWVKARPALAGTDYIHFTPRGAEQISQILYDTFLLYYKFYCFRKNES